MQCPGTEWFEYGNKGAADQIRTTWEKIANHVGKVYDHDISNDLKNKKQIDTP